MDADGPPFGGGAVFPGLLAAAPSSEPGLGVLLAALVDVNPLRNLRNDAFGPLAVVADSPRVPLAPVGFPSAAAAASCSFF